MCPEITRQREAGGLMQMEEESGGGEGEEEVRSYKILVLGNSGAGKTSLVRRSVRSSQFLGIT